MERFCSSSAVWSRMPVARAARTVHHLMSGEIRVGAGSGPVAQFCRDRARRTYSFTRLRDGCAGPFVLVFG